MRRFPRAILLAGLVAALVASHAGATEPAVAQCGRIAVPDVPGSRTASYHPYTVAVLKGTTSCLDARRLLRSYHMTFVDPLGWTCARWHGSDDIAATCVAPEAEVDLDDATDAIRSYPDATTTCAQRPHAGRFPGLRLGAASLHVSGGLACRAGARVVHAYLAKALRDVEGCAAPAVNAPFDGCVVRGFRCRSYPLVPTPKRYCSDRRGRWVDWRERDLSAY
jgi:hypothetical protein